MADLLTSITSITSIHFNHISISSHIREASRLSSRIRGRQSKPPTVTNMASLLFNSPFRPALHTTCTILGAGIGLSLLHPSSPFRSPPMQCQYTAPYYNPHASPESGWSLAGSEAVQKQGKTSYAQQRQSTGLLNARYMRQISFGSVLGLATGLGLRVFSKALVFVLGVGIVLVEVRLPPPPLLFFFIIISAMMLTFSAISLVGCIKGL